MTKQNEPQKTIMKHNNLDISHNKKAQQTIAKHKHLKKSQKTTKHITKHKNDEKNTKTITIYDKP